VTKALTAVLVVAMVAWTLYMILAVSAYGHTLPMSEIRRGITEAIQDKFPGRRIVVGLSACQRTDAHGGRCKVRVYTLSEHQKWCGSGWARLIGESDYMRAHGTLNRC
jgi:hypothetical protein